MNTLVRYILMFLFTAGIVECQAQIKITKIEQLANTKWKLVWKRTLDSVSFSAKEKTYILHFREKQCVDFYYGNEKMGSGRYRTRRNGFVSIKPYKSCKKANEKYMINPPYGNNPK